MCVIRSILLTAALFAFAGTTEATELKVMGDAPLGPALSKIADLYRQQTNTHNCVGPMSAFGGKADMKPTRGNVRLWTQSGHCLAPT